MGVEIQGLDSVIKRLEGVADAAKMKQAITKATLLVERSAKQNAQALSEGDGTLAGSITSKIDDYEGVVYTPLFYAPYVEFGTGIEAEGGKGRQDVPWVFVKHSGVQSGNAQKSYTLETAKEAVAALREKGLEAYYTYGQKPQPFMRPALDNNRDQITDILRGGLKQK
jgi:HK97 gp10 family phage protein